MRQKSYYTANEITNNLYTPGKEWVLIDGTDYIGLYHKYSTGEVYTSPEWDSKVSKKLTAYIEQPTNNKIYKQLNSVATKYKTPSFAAVTITTADVARGFCFRFFIKKINQTNIIEIDELQYNEWLSKNIDTNLYTAVKIMWYITGNVRDVDNNPAIRLGIITKNSAQIKQAESLMPGLRNKLPNLLQYYTDTDFTVPKDINQ